MEQPHILQNLRIQPAGNQNRKYTSSANYAKRPTQELSEWQSLPQLLSQLVQLLSIPLQVGQYQQFPNRSPKCRILLPTVQLPERPSQLSSLPQYRQTIHQYKWKRPRPGPVHLESNHPILHAAQTKVVDEQISSQCQHAFSLPEAEKAGS